MARVRIERVDPRELDLDTADTIAAMISASDAAAGLPLPERTGAACLLSRQLQTDGHPVDAMFLAYDGDRLVGEAVVELPWRDNTDMSVIRGQVHPDARRRGIGTALKDEALSFGEAQGRERLHIGAYVGSAGVPVLDHWGFTRTAVNAIRRLDVHAAPHGLWDRLHDEAAAHAGDYEVVRQVGSTPPERYDDLVRLHDAINDAPSPDPAIEPDAWDAQRLTDYERAMAGRRQTLYRVMVRHRVSGEWAGQSLLCVDEFSPQTAFQEDTSVVRAHRGHRLGLLMKAEMLRWVSTERPEVGSIDTWNAVSNHHMIAINERLGATVVAEHQSYRLDRAR
jgi:GNAT superfamily N-acetyltransferase/RimJ/RimL family protein N-acetyltransferase